MGGKRWNDEEKKILKDMNINGFNYSQIAKRLGRTLTSCQQMGKRLGLHGDMNVTHDFFNLETEEKYYILGYWLADGCIMKKSGGHYFSLVSNDKDHLENISKIMGVKTRIYKNSFEAYELRVGSKRLVDSIIEIGGSYRKTKTMTINDITFDKKHFYTLLRGFFDGDGGYTFQGFVKADGTRSISSIKFTGSKMMIKSIYEYLGYGKLYEDYRKGDCYYLSFYGDEMRDLLHKMYNNSNIHLERKYQTYKQALQ
ncbi:LAGLIDADG family homing endonuclease [Heyndrickxia faecalis]|uniref:LAGLIDADG family homing endonuclease n=1 Tax=Heyndrickxia TaxID=2837504 RepID=UPI002E2128F0|nr:LAGLIDADG family homing endonuclease [Weizmannia sp. CD-2023]MED4977237.1 LAGLIDADG family homing endonuclease [Weizmannia sp. CD-2023]